MIRTLDDQPLDEALARAWRARRAVGCAGAAEGLIRVTVDVAALEPLSWLAAVPAGTFRSGWVAREGGLALVGIGAALRFAVRPLPEGREDLRTVRAVLARSDAGARVIGGLRFDRPGVGEPGWRGFQESWLVAPRLELACEGGHCRVSLQARADGPEAVELEAGLALVRALGAPEGTGAGRKGLPSLCGRRDTPDRDAWEEKVGLALAAFQEGRMDKVVLARHARFAAEGAIDPAALARCLREVTAGCYHFFFQPAGGDAFMGASPERLYGRLGRDVLTEAVAGTRPRGQTVAVDVGFAEALLTSDKDRREHAYVCDGIRSALDGICDDVTLAEQPALIKLAMGQHLHTAVRGSLRSGRDDGDLLAALHPTPALGGWPREPALRAIAAWEGFDRGWYGGPVGWMTRDAAEFAVAIRSALVDAGGLSLFSGAGIVAGSTAEDEWSEIEQKIANFVSILGE